MSRRKIADGVFGRIAVGLVSLALYCWGATAQADTTISFDNLPPNTPVTDQYHALGIDFTLSRSMAMPATSQVPWMTCCTPITRTEPGPTPQVLSVSWGNAEFYTAGTLGLFSSAHRRMQLTVGSDSKANVKVVAYDADGAIVAQTAEIAITNVSPQIAALDAVQAKIQSFSIQATGLNQSVWISSIAFDAASPAATPDFLLGLPGGSQFVAATEGYPRAWRLPINRFNGSNGPIVLNATGLPPGVAAYFAPNPVGGTDTYSDLTLVANVGAAGAVATGFTVTGIPKSVAAGTSVRSESLTLNVDSALTLSALPNALDVLPCSEEELNFWVSRSPPYDEDVTWSLVSIATPGSASLSDVIATFDPPTMPRGTTSGYVKLKLRLSSNIQDKPDSLAAFIRGTSSSMVKDSPVFSVRLLPSSIDSINPTNGFSPQFLQPGSLVSIRGRGFCADRNTDGTFHTFVVFGDGSAGVTGHPESVTNTEIRVRVPRDAMTGTLQVGGDSTVRSSQVFTVDNFRNTSGFAFHNFYPRPTFDQLSAAYGENQTYIEIPLCLVGCVVKIRDPWAMLLLALARTKLTGDCFGMALGSYRLTDGISSRSPYPPTGATTNYTLASDSGPSGSLTEYLNTEELQTFSVELIADYLGPSLTAAQLHSALRQLLSSGEPPIISLTGPGHAVLAYDLEETPDGGYVVYVYDSNLPFQGNLDSAFISKLIFDSNGSWKYLGFPNDSGFATSGGPSDLLIIAPSRLPLHPTLPSPAGLANALVLATSFPVGGANAAAASETIQIESQSGHLMFDANRTLNRDPATRIRASRYGFLDSKGSTLGRSGELFVVDKSEGSLVQSFVGRTTGRDRHLWVSPGAAITVEQDVVEGVIDYVAVTPAGAVSIRNGGASRSLSASLEVRSGATRRVVEIATVSRAGMEEDFRFTDDREGIVIAHGNSEAPLTVRLSSIGGNVIPSLVETAPFSLPAGATATIKPDRWLTPSSISLTVHTADGKERRAVLANRHISRASGGEIVSIERDDSSERARQVKARIRFSGLSASGQTTIGWTVRRGNRIVSHANRVLADSEVTAGLHSISLPFEEQGRGEYSVTVDVLTTTYTGLIPTVERSTRTAEFRRS